MAEVYDFDAYKSALAPLRQADETIGLAVLYVRIAHEDGSSRSELREAAMTLLKALDSADALSPDPPAA